MEISRLLDKEVQCFWRSISLSYIRDTQFTQREERSPDKKQIFILPYREYKTVWILKAGVWFKACYVLLIFFSELFLLLFLKRRRRVGLGVEGRYFEIHRRLGVWERRKAITAWIRWPRCVGDEGQQAVSGALICRTCILKSCCFRALPIDFLEWVMPIRK